jgi:SH3 domain-containing protein/TonB-like protein
MRRIGALLPLLLVACSQAPDEATDTREPIAIQYVGGQQMAVHASPDDKSRVITRYQHSESVPVLARKGDWAEVRTALGSGWVHQSELVSAEEGAQSKGNPKPRFQRPPSPVASPGTHGTIYIEADVNTDGDVTGTTIIENSTGSANLASQNEEALRRSKFYPIVIHGERKPFKYYYRVDY